VVVEAGAKSKGNRQLDDDGLNMLGARRNNAMSVLLMCRCIGVSTHARLEIDQRFIRLDV
jgi:hypothetical protein